MAKKKLDIFLGMNNAELKTKLNESKNLINGFQATLGGVLGGAALGVSIKTMGDFAINASKSFEQAQISFTQMLQSEKAGQKLINDIQALANVTPMTTQGLADNAKLLLNFNAVAEDDVIPTLKMLGDITGGNQQRMDSLTLAFAQSASAGRLMGQDLLQMINAGFNPLQIISEKTGKSIGALKEEMSKGKISTEMVVQAFKDATAAGGKFYGMMEAQSQSKAGLESTKADNLEIFARTISDKAMPALKEFDKAQIEALQNATLAVEKMGEWAEVNNQTTNAISNTALALVTAVAGFGALSAIVSTVSKVHLESVAAVKAYELAQAQAAIAAEVAAGAEQALYAARLKGDEAMIKNCVSLRASTAAKAAETAATASNTQATVLQYAATGNLTQALKLAIVQTRALTVAMLENPFTWVALAIGGVTTAFFALKNSCERTQKAIEDLNNAQDQNVNKTTDAIRTLKELGGAQNLNYEQTKKLDSAVAYLTEKYPKYIGKLEQELRLKGEISKATAKQIANEMLLAKVKRLASEREKVNKDIKRDLFINQFRPGAIHAGGRYGLSKATQRKDDALNAEKKRIEKERQAIIDELTGATVETKSTWKSASMTTPDKKDTKAERAAEKARKEAIALSDAKLDAELLKVQKNSEEEYKLELKKINAKIALEKVGTAKYQEALNERTRLQQKHQEDLAQIEITAYNNKIKIQELKIEKEKALIDIKKENDTISNEDYYKKLLEFEDKKYQIKLAALEREEELSKNDVVKYKEKLQEKLELEISHEIEKQKITNEAKEAELEEWKQVKTQLGSSFKGLISDFISGNKTLKDSFLSMFGEIEGAFATLIANMIAKKAMLGLEKGVGLMAGAGGWLGTLGSFFQGFFADGGIVPGSYNQPAPIVAHGSEMVLNPLQQKNLWNLIAGSGANVSQNATQSATNTNNQQPVNVYNITPVFQSLDPAQGQKMFNGWMKQSGVPLVRESIKNNTFQMRDVIKGV